MDDTQPDGLSAEELAAEGGVALPDKEVVSILDLNADLDLAIDAAAPIDLGVAANANVAAPIDAAASANVLSEGSTSQALADQGVMVSQDVNADAIADSTQDSGIDQGASPDDAAGTTYAAPAPTSDAGPDGSLQTPIADTMPTDGSTGDLDGTVDGATDDLGGTVDGATGDVGSTVGDVADGDLLNVNVNLDGDANVAAPINGAVAANANVAAPIDAAVSANIGSVDSESVAVAQQDAIINQTIDGSAEANADQSSDIQQP